jgi:hypothetical protein
MFKKGFSKSWKKVLGFLSGKDDVRAGIFLSALPFLLVKIFTSCALTKAKTYPNPVS